jgi:hypothetical protein
MYKDFTLLFLMQHYPISQQLQVIRCDDISVDSGVAGFLQTSEKQTSKYVLDKVYAAAAAAVQH